MEGPIEDLGELIEESDLDEVRINVGAKTIALRLGILARPRSGSSERPRIWLTFRGVHRVAAWLREVEYFANPTDARPWAMGSRPLFPPIVIDGVDDLSEWLSRFRGTLYGQAYPQFDLPDPEWLAHGSIDLGWPTGGGAHTVDIGFDTTFDAGQRVLDLRLWFDDAIVLDDNMSEVPADPVVESVRQWWRDFRDGNTGGQYGYVPAGA